MEIGFAAEKIICIWIQMIKREFLDVEVRKPLSLDSEFHR